MTYPFFSSTESVESMAVCPSTDFGRRIYFPRGEVKGGSPGVEISVCWREGGFREERDDGDDDVPEYIDTMCVRMRRYIRCVCVCKRNLLGPCWAPRV